jgi:hypothetical protein
MPHLRLRHILPLVAALVSAACASTSQGAAKKAERITPPQQLRGGPPPEIREVVDIRYEVLVNADGQPDLRTLKVTGKGAGSVRTAIEDWIRNSMFKPAMQDGLPVAGLYRGGIKTRVEVHRM